MKHTSTQPRTKWTILHYGHPYDLTEVWRQFGLPDDIHIIWTQDLVTLELWYGGGRHATHTIEELLLQFHVYDS